MVGDAAEGDVGSVGVLVAGGEGDVEDAGGLDRIIQKHLVKIAQAKKKYCIRIIGLYLKILPHHRCQFGHKNPLLLVLQAFILTKSTLLVKQKQSGDRSSRERPARLESRSVTPQGHYGFRASKEKYVLDFALFCQVAEKR